MDEFLEEMDRITAATAEPTRKGQTTTKTENHKTEQCGKYGKKGHTTKTCQVGSLTCFLCKAPGHRMADCPKAKRKDMAKGQSHRAVETVEATAATDSHDDEEVVASVLERQKNIKISNRPVILVRINNNRCKLNALMDTGSPVSYAKRYCIKVL